MGRVIIFSIGTCKHCRKAKRILSECDVKYEDINVEHPKLRNFLRSFSNRATVPQIYFNEEHIGGASDLEELEKNGTLEERLKKVEEMDIDMSKFGDLEQIQKAILREQEEKKKQDNEEEESSERAGDNEDFVKENEDKEEEVLFDEVVEKMLAKKDGMSIESRTYHLKSYHHCFVGKEFVSWLNCHGYGDTREEALAFGQRMMDKLYFHHVCYAHPLLDGHFFYRLQLHEESEVLNKFKLFSGKARPINEIAKNMREIMMKLVDNFITDDYRVDYTSMRSSELFTKEYRNATIELQRVDLSALTVDERKAFFINIYNSLVIHGFIEVGVPKNAFQRNAFFSKTSYQIGSHKYSLTDIENGMLRGNRTPPNKFKRLIKKSDPRAQYILTKMDPRIHFALNCGAKSCPPIKVFSSEDIDDELDLAAAGFMESEVIIDKKRPIMKISKIFSWYKVDFGGSSEKLIQFIKPYLIPERRDRLENYQQVGATVRVKYLKYDWGTNSK